MVARQRYPSGSGGYQRTQDCRETQYLATPDLISVICTLIGFLIVAWRCADKNTTSVKARLKNGETVKLPCIAYSESLDKISPFFMDPIENPYGGILCVYSKHHEYLTLETASYISPKSWNSLAIKLFIRDTHSEAFTQIYPIDENTKPHIKIWEIHYSPDIKANPKYLKTGLPELDKTLGLQ